MKARALLAILFAFRVSTLLGQSPAPQGPETRLQYGVNFSLRWEIVFKYGYLSNFRFDVAGGVGALLGENVMPFAQYSISAFQGGLGSSLSVRERGKVNVENALGLGVTGGDRRNHERYFRRPLYTMGRLMPTPLYNPFNFYATLASINIFRLTKFSTPDYRDKYRFTQRVGSLSLGTRGFDFNYYNDGTPYQWMGLGDGKDRYWTGGGFVNVHIRNKYDYSDAGNRSNGIVRNIFIGFDRFTGNYPESFEVANALRLNSVPYGDKTQAFMNKGRTYAGFELAGIPGFAPFFSLNDRNKFDIQYLIHKIRKQPIHKTLHDDSNGLNLFYSRNYWDL
jgi:hypothetical protein